ncbi:MAG: helix-turn-helix transcriptional regulator [Candidatus Sphingomonas colombiensis]|nr:helix-turn-helix transcriptional regulator [Sphingomonas sp.]WEK42953.1 MAG: helix-turn-helix transcriptional regulator [Sphingomonas sp.]
MKHGELRAGGAVLTGDAARAPVVQTLGREVEICSQNGWVDGIDQRTIIMSHAHASWRTPGVYILQGLLFMAIQDDTVSLEGMLDIRDRLREAVTRTGARQVEVARRAGITPQRLSNYLQRGTLPDVETLVRLAQATGVSTDYLLGLSDSGPVEITPIVNRLLELEGLSADRVALISDAVQEALRILIALPNEGDALLRSRMAAQTAWHSQVGSKPN